MRAIGVLTSGGDAPGMNACIRAVVRTGVHWGCRVIGIRRGFRGLVAGDWRELGGRDVSNIIQRGGTILGTARCQEFETREGRERAIQQMAAAGIEGLVVIGRDGSFRGAAALAEESQVKVVGVPGTIDNDVYGTDITIGFDTAVNTALESVDRIRDTAASLERLFFVEVMGRSTGFIAAEVGLAGGAEEVLVPESVTDIAKLCDTISQCRQRGKTSIIVVVAEGGEAGGAFAIARQVKARLGLDFRVCVLGHVQRGGAPTAGDRILASRLGTAAVTALLEGRSGQMVGQVGGQIVLTPLPQTWQNSKPLDRSMLDLVRMLAE